MLTIGQKLEFSKASFAYTVHKVGAKYALINYVNPKGETINYLFDESAQSGVYLSKNVKNAEKIFDAIEAGTKTVDGKKVRSMKVAEGKKSKVKAEEVKVEEAPCAGCETCDSEMPVAEMPVVETTETAETVSPSETTAE